MAKRKRRKFTPEFKAEAVRPCQVGDRSAGQVATLADPQQLYPGVAAIGEQTGRKQAASQSHVSGASGWVPGYR